MICRCDTILHMKRQNQSRRKRTGYSRSVPFGGRARHRSGSHLGNRWQTPPKLVDEIRNGFGGRIGLDPCTEPENPTGAVRFFTVETDGINQSWRARTIYVNPPYSDVGPWIRKAIEVARGGARIYMLLPVRTDASYHQELMYAATDILLLKGRLRFSRPDGSVGAGAAFCSMLVGIGTSVRPLAHLGVIVAPTGFGVPT